MKGNIVTKFILTVFLATGLAGTLAGCSGLQYKTRAEDIQAMAENIAEYTLPDGYTEQAAIEVMGYQMLSMQGPNPSNHLYLIQAPAESDLDIAELQQKAQSMSTENSGKSGRDMKLIETRTVTIRGQETKLLVSEGVNSEGAPYRDATALFEGKSGPALVSMSSPISEWDQELVDNFLSSLK